MAITLVALQHDFFFLRIAGLSMALASLMKMFRSFEVQRRQRVHRKLHTQCL